MTQRGSILIFSVLLMGIIMSITLVLSNIFLPKIRVASEAVNSTIAAYAADSALERCIYFVRMPVAQRPGIPPPLAMSNGATVNVYRGQTSTLANCYEPILNHRAVGTYNNITRSFIVQEQ